MILINRSEFDAMTVDQQFNELQFAQMAKQNAEQTLRFLFADLEKVRAALKALGRPTEAGALVHDMLSGYRSVALNPEARRLMQVGRAATEGRAA